MVFFKYFFLKNEEIFTDRVVDINDLSESLSQKILLEEYYKSFNNFFKIKENNLNYSFYIDQTDLFRKFVFVSRYRKLFKLIYEGKVISARSGFPYLSELISIASKKKGNYIFMPQRYFQNLLFFCSSLLKLFFNFISLIRLIIKNISSDCNFIIIHTSNNFFGGKKYDYRISHLMEEFDDQKKDVAFFIRTRHKPLKIIFHYFRRKRLSFYSDNIVGIVVFFEYFREKFRSNFLNDKSIYKADFNQFLSDIIFENHLARVKSLNINSYIFKYIYKLLGTKYFIGDNSYRSVIEFLSAKKIGIKTISFQNGTEFEFFMTHKYLNNNLAPNLKPLSHDVFYTWNSHWNNYYKTKSKLFNDENLKIGGFYRDIRTNNEVRRKLKKRKNNLPILFLIENETPIREVIDYILLLLDKNQKLVFKLRPQQKDAGDSTFELIMNSIPNKFLHSDQIGKTNLSFKNLDLSLFKCALGSYTTALIDCLLGELDVFFINTMSWSDCFNIKTNKIAKDLYCDNPNMLIERINDLDKYEHCQNELKKILLPIYDEKFISKVIFNLM